MILKLKPEYVYIAIDGVAPMGKILQQRQRRYKYLFDNEIKLVEKEQKILIETITDENISVPLKPISSIELTPGTPYMERIHLLMINYLEQLKQKNIKCIYSSYHQVGEGEHKILQYIKTNIKPNNTIVIYGLDADLLFLSLSVDINCDLYVMREQQIFSNEKLDFDKEINYNYVKIKDLQVIINELEININDFIVCCYLVGNDFLPALLTLDIKKGGLDKILTAYSNVKNKFTKEKFNTIVNIKIINNKKTFSINHNFLFELFVQLQRTETFVWENMNRGDFTNKNIKYNKDDSQELKKFISGESANIDCLNKIEFNSKLEYYNHYLGLNELSSTTTIIKQMVHDYIVGIEWCINYYFDDCKCWKQGYNFSISPLISDIVNYYPKKIKLTNTKCELNPIEGLLLAIPPNTYKYVISSEIINKLKEHKRIGYMFPQSFDLDINKESMYWKCNVNIPMVEYNEYLNVIKTLNISDVKNKIGNDIKNF